MNNNYFLITWHEGGDEIHFLLMDMEDYDYVNSLYEKLTGHNSSDEIEELLAYCYDNALHMYSIQTYCNEEWPFSRYKIKRILSIPEFGM